MTTTLAFDLSMLTLLTGKSSLAGGSEPQDASSKREIAIARLFIPIVFFHDVQVHDVLCLWTFHSQSAGTFQ
jgi:hypothetical protein